MPFPTPITQAKELDAALDASALTREVEALVIFLVPLCAALLCGGYATYLYAKARKAS